MARRRAWSAEESLIAFRLYCHTPFGRLHKGNQEIIELARLLGRTPSAVGMKACNFAGLDPMQRARNIRGLGNAAQRDREIWDEFAENPEAVAAKAEAAYERLRLYAPAMPDVAAARAAARRRLRENLGPSGMDIPTGPTEVTRPMRARRVQAFFRAAVLASYEYRCALSELALPELINASHIIPWQESVARRADPRNGLALNALYDRAFDRGLITLDENMRVVVSRRLKDGVVPVFQAQALVALEGRTLRKPVRFFPDACALAWHRQKVFCS